MPYSRYSRLSTLSAVAADVTAKDRVLSYFPLADLFEVQLRDNIGNAKSISRYGFTYPFYLFLHTGSKSASYLRYESKRTASRVKEGVYQEHAPLKQWRNPELITGSPLNKISRAAKKIAFSDFSILFLVTGA